MLTSIFTPDQCASCKLCCNFHHCSAWETPFLEPALAEQLQRTFHVELFRRPDNSLTFRLPFTSQSEDAIANCPMLDTASGCRLPRDQRPFECRIWPLRVMRRTSGEAVLGCYMDCPALDRATAERLVNYAQHTLRPLIIDYARHYPQTIRPCDPHYRIIDELPELNS